MHERDFRAFNETSVETRRRRWTLSIILMSVALLPLTNGLGQDVPKPMQTSKATDTSLKEINDLIGKLSDPSAKVRKDATTRLKQIGEPAWDALQKAAQSDDVETKASALEILQRFGDDLARKRSARIKEKSGLRCTFPNEVPSIPNSYDIQLSSRYAVIRLHRRTTGVSGERITRTEVSRARLPIPAVDEILKTILLLKTAELPPRPPEERLRRIYNSGLKFKLRVSTSGKSSERTIWYSMESIYHSHWYENEANGLMKVIHSYVARAIHDLVEDTFKPVTPDDALTAEMLKRLQVSIAGKASDMDVLTDLAVHLKIVGAIPVFEASGREIEADRIRILSMKDPSEILRAHLCSKDYERYAWALKHFKTALQPKDQHRYARDVIKHAKSQYVLREVLVHLRTLKPDQETIKALRNSLERLSEDKITQAEVQGTLLRMTDDETALQALLKTVSVVPAKLDRLPEHQRQAAKALVEHAMKIETRKEVIGDALKKMLKRIPMDAHSTYSGMDMLIIQIGQLGRAKDAELIAGYFNHNSRYVAIWAVEAMYRIDRKRAVAEARRHFATFIEKKGGGYAYHNQIANLIALVWAADAQEAVAELKKIKGMFFRVPALSHDPESNWERIARLDAVIGFLEAKDPAGKVTFANTYHGFGGRVPKRYAKSVAERLIKQGADPKALAKLLKEE